MNQAPKTDSLNEAAPNCSVEFTQNFVRDVYGIDGKAKQLACERDQIFQVCDADGERFVLRFTNPAEDRSVTNFQTEAMRHLVAVSPDLPIPRVVSCKDGLAEIEVMLEDGRTSIARMITFLTGVPLASVPERNPGIRTDMARTIAKMGHAFRGFFHPAAGYELLWDLKHAVKLRELLGCIENNNTRQLATQGLDNFERYVLPVQATLRAQVIHNDLNFSNVMIDEHKDEISGILDFGDMIHAPLIYDVAVAAAYQLSGEDDDALTVLTDFVRAYHEIVPLEEVELTILYDLIVTRQVMTLAITEWRASLYPENSSYILRNHAFALKAIQRLEKIDRKDAANAFIAACMG